MTLNRVLFRPHWDVQWYFKWIVSNVIPLWPEGVCMRLAIWNFGEHFAGGPLADFWVRAVVGESEGICSVPLGVKPWTPSTESPLKDYLILYILRCFLLVLSISRKTGCCDLPPVLSHTRLCVDPVAVHQPCARSVFTPSPSPLPAPRAAPIAVRVPAHFVLDLPFVLQEKHVCESFLY